MDKNIFVILCLIATSVATLKAQPIDYENADVFGNSITGKDNAYPHLNGVSGDYHEYNDVSKRVPEIFEGSSQKRNIISALRSKMRRSKVDVEDKLRFSPVLSVDALGNLNGFFDNLATNIHTMESRNLLPNQMRLLGETENRPRENYGHSAAFINSVRAYQSPKNIRMLMNYQPDTHRNSNFYDPVLSRIGLGK